MSYHPYVFGTWVPVVTLVGGGGNTVPVYTTNSGTYTRIGRTVFFNILLTGDGGAEGAGTGVFTLTLPFSTAASQLEILVPCGVFGNGAAEHLLFAHYIPSSATFHLATDTVVAARVENTDVIGDDQNNAARYIEVMGKILVQ
jgi:hypothetical protein